VRGGNTLVRNKSVAGAVELQGTWAGRVRARVHVCIIYIYISTSRREKKQEKVKNKYRVTGGGFGSQRTHVSGSSARTFST